MMKVRLMKKEIAKTLEDYLCKLEEDESVCEQIKRVVLEQIGLGSQLEPYIKRCLKICEQKGYAYGTPLAYTMMFFITYSRNLELGITYNEKARELFMKLPDYKERDGILTVANNAVLVHILKEDYGAAYREILDAMPIAKKRKHMTYYSAFLNNGAIILSEFGLYKKAIQQVEETLHKRDFIGESNFYVTIYLLSYLYLCAGEITKLQELLNTYVPEMIKGEYFDHGIFYKLYLETSIYLDHPDEAKHYYELMMKEYAFQNNDLADNSEVYLAIARYAMYIKDYERAQTYYDKILQHKEELLGHKRQVLEEVSHLYECRKEYDKAYVYMKEAHDKTMQYLSFIDDMYRKELEDVWQENRMLSYEVLYDRLLEIIEFGKDVSSTLDRKQLLTLLEEHTRRIFTYDTLHLLLYSKNDSYVTDQDGITCHLDDIPLLKECVQDKKSLHLNNLDQEIQRQIETIWHIPTRSLMVQPVLYQGTIVAIFLIESSQIGAFSRTDQSLLQIITDYLAIALHNISQFEEAIEKSSYDYLTKTYNRSALMLYGEEMLHKAILTQSSIGVLMADIDDFKNVNDTYGHMLGDEVIRQVTNIMNQEKEHGILARFGGEEFILLMDGIQMEELYEVAERIRYACEQCTIETREEPIHFTISIGCCYRQPAQGTLQELFQEADQRMYIAKRNGKNCVQM